MKFVYVLGAFVVVALAYCISRRRNPRKVNLLSAVKDGKLRIVEELVKTTYKNPDAVVDTEHNTPLLVACREGHLEVVKFLVNNAKCSLTAKNVHQFSPLNMACYSEASDELVLFLLGKGSIVDSIDQNGWTPLHMAVSKGCTRLVKLLLENGSEIDAQTSMGQTALLIASNNGSTECVRLLLSRSADPTLRTHKTLDSPLILATANGHTEIVKMLLNKRRDLMTLATHDGSSPIHVAVARKNLEMVKLLLSFGADINMTKKDGSNAIHVIIGNLSRKKEKKEREGGEVQLVKDLVAIGCTLDSRDSFGSTPLHKTCTKKNVALCLTLLELGASPNVVDNDKLSPLHVLCSSSIGPQQYVNPGDDIKIFEGLVKHGIKLDDRDKLGATAIHTAVCREWNGPLLKLMLSKNPSLVFVADKTQRTPLHLALQVYPSHSQIINILREFMSRENPKFFDSFDPKLMVPQLHNTIDTNLSEAEQKIVLGGDVSVRGIAKRIKDGSIKQIVVLTGAGISTNAGIPDFRTPGKGLYTDPEIRGNVLSMSNFSMSPDDFFGVLKKSFLPVFKGAFKPTKAHYFISILHRKNLLQRLYTQNIDSLELKAGIPQEKCIESHGTVATATCLKCRKSCTDMDNFWVEIENDELPTCKHCASSGIRSVLKPDVVLFGEPLPAKFFDLQREDFSACQLLIVIGTSLKVYPFAGLVNSVNETVPRLLFNQEAVGAFTKGSKENKTKGIYDTGLIGTYRDVAYIGDIDEGISALVQELGWEDELHELVNGQTTTNSTTSTNTSTTTNSTTSTNTTSTTTNSTTSTNTSTTTTSVTNA